MFRPGWWAKPWFGFSPTHGWLLSPGASSYVGAVLVAYLVAFGGGIVSFLSPCVLPLVPAYLSIVTGLEVAEVQSGAKGNAKRIAWDTALFVAGFGTVFVLLGLSATVVGRALFDQRTLLTRLSGVVIIAMAAFMLLSALGRLPGLQRERRFHISPRRYGNMAAPIAGAAFAFGWTPCIGPVLASLLALASTSTNTFQGASLLASYTAGLGLCFLAAGLAAGKLATLFGWVKRHFTAITATSSTVMAAFGVLLVMNRLITVTTSLQQAMTAIGLGHLAYLG